MKDEESNVVVDPELKTEKPDEKFMAGLEAAADQVVADEAGYDDRLADHDSDKVSPDDEKPGEVDNSADGVDEPVGEFDDESDESGADDGDEDPVVDEALLERAVRAGMTIAEANSVSDPGVLASIVGRMESVTSVGTKASEEGNGAPEEEVFNVEEILNEIPDLDPEEFPEEMVSTVKGLKDLVGKIALHQQGTIDQLRQEITASAAASAETWADSQYAKLGSDYESTFGKGTYADLPDGPQRAARDRLSRHAQFVQDDAKLDGKEITKADAFEKALELGFSDVVKKMKGKKTKSDASRRAAQTVNRPRRSDGQFASEKEDLSTEEGRENSALAAVAALMQGDDF